MLYMKIIKRLNPNKSSHHMEEIFFCFFNFVSTWDEGCSLKLLWQSLHELCKSNLMPYALNTYSAVCWLYLNKTGRHKRKTQLKWPSMYCVCMCGMLCICICCVLRYICISVHVCTVYFWMCIWVLCVHTYTRPYMCVMLCISMHDCACVCMCVLLCTCVSVHMSVLCMCTCVYVYKHTPYKHSCGK